MAQTDRLSPERLAEIREDTYRANTRAGLTIDPNSVEDQRADLLNELDATKADLARAEAEVARWVAADGADIAAGSYAGEVERLRQEVAVTSQQRDWAQTELAETRAKLDFIATCAWGLSDSSDAEVSSVAYALNDLAKGETTLAEAFEALPEEWRPEPPAAAVDGAQAATDARMAHGDAERGQEEPQPSKAATGTTQAGIEAPAASGESDAIGGGR